MSQSNPTTDATLDLSPELAPSESSPTTDATLDMSPELAPSESSETTINRASSAEEEHHAAIARWRFARTRNRKEHSDFRERMLFQSADFHQFLAETARTSPQVAVPSPAWEDIPFPVPRRARAIVEEDPEDSHLELSGSFDEIQEVPLRRATPMDFSSQLQEPSTASRIPSINFDRSSYDGSLGGFEMQDMAAEDHDTRPANRETMIRVGAVFHVGPESQYAGSTFTRASDLAPGQMPDFVRTATEMADLGGDKLPDAENPYAFQLQQARKEQRNCILMPFAWIGRQFGKLF